MEQITTATVRITSRVKVVMCRPELYQLLMCVVQQSLDNFNERLPKEFLMIAEHEGTTKDSLVEYIATYCGKDDTGRGEFFLTQRSKWESGLLKGEHLARLWGVKDEYYSGKSIYLVQHFQKFSSWFDESESLSFQKFQERCGFYQKL